MRHTLKGIYVTCDEPGCHIQTGGICTEHGERGEPFAHWDIDSTPGKDFCKRHRKDGEDS